MGDKTKQILKSIAAFRKKDRSAMTEITLSTIISCHTGMMTEGEKRKVEAEVHLYLSK